MTNWQHNFDQAYLPIVQILILDMEEIKKREHIFQELWKHYQLQKL